MERFDVEGLGPGDISWDAQVRTVAEAIPVPTIVSRASDGQILYANRHLIDAVGLSLRELLGRTTAEFYYDPAERPAMIERLRRHGHTRNYETRARRSDGSPWWLLASSQVITFGDEEAVITVLHDITERKDAEEALRLSDEVLRKIPDAVMLTDRYGSIVRWTGAAQEIFGYTEEEAIGNHVGFVHARSSSAAITREIAEAIRTEGTFFGEIPCVRKDGSEVIIEATIRAVYDADGKPLALVGVNRDTTERRRRREALLRWARVFEHAEWGIAVGSADGRTIELTNPAFARMHGYTVEELLNRSSADVFAPDLRDHLDELSHVTDETGHRTYETEHVRKDGSVFPVLIDATIVRDANGRVMHRIVNVQDITERRRAEESLRESEARNRALLELIPDTMYRIGSDLVYRGFFPGKHVVPPLSLGEILGKRVYDVLPRELAEATARAVGDALRTGEVQSFEYVQRLRDSRRDFEARILAMNDEEALAIVRDVTARKQAEEALRYSEERYRALYEDNPSMYFTVDEEGTVLSVNRFGAEQLGYAPEELVGRSVLTVFYEEDREAVRNQLRKCLLEPGRVAQWEFRKVRKQGSLMWVKEMARAVRSRADDMIVLLVCEDISERKQAEEALQEAREELESKVEKRLQMGTAYGLTFRELSVLHLVAAGRSDKEIAILLSISPRTVSKHIENILGKMKASSRTEASVRAVRENLVD